MNEPRRIKIRRMAGFTLVEAVIVIVITGILAGIVAVFIARPVQGYIDTVRRAELTDAADTALKRIARDVRTALPNSVRPLSSGDVCFEFLPTVGGGRYRVAPGSTGTDVLEFSTTDSSFDVLASDNLTTAMFAASTYHAVIYNLGIAGADAYDATTNPTNTNRAQIKSTSTVANIVLNAGNKFPFESPGKRFHVIPDFSVTYSCTPSGDLIRVPNQPIPAAHSACPTSGGTVLVSNVTSCLFTYAPGISARNGLLTITLVLTDSSGESVRLYDEVHVNNVP